MIGKRTVVLLNPSFFTSLIPSPKIAMRRFIFLLLLLLSELNVNGQWIQLNSDTLHDYNSVYFINPDTGFVCGSVYLGWDGVILRTMNGGISWDTTFLGYSLADISFINDSVGFTGGQDGGIYKTTDTGNNWNFLGSFGNNNDFSNIYFLNQDTGIVHDFYGTIGLFTPGLFPPSSNFFNSTADTWFPGTGELSRTQNIFYAAGGYGKFLKSIDNGMSWNYFNCDTNFYVFDAKMTDQNHIVIVGGTATQTTSLEYGKSTVSQDGGLTWSTPNQFAPHDIVGVDFYDSLFGYSVGGINSVWWYNPNAVGSLWQTSDGGYNWTLVDSNYSDLLTDIQVVNDSLAYAVGFDGTILKNVTHYTSLGLNPNDIMQSISIFPNPFNAEITIQLPNSHPNDIEINVFDVTGRMIIQQAIHSTKQIVSLNAETWSDGVYFIQMKRVNHNIVKKAIKQK
jgi:photosystem II stability/assembly factor-like uncharacterized protein